MVSARPGWRRTFEFEKVFRAESRRRDRLYLYAGHLGQRVLVKRRKDRSLGSGRKCEKGFIYLFILFDILLFLSFFGDCV